MNEDRLREREVRALEKIAEHLETITILLHPQKVMLGSDQKPEEVQVPQRYRSS